jgi:hypothetical protein
MWQWQSEGPKSDSVDSAGALSSYSLQLSPMSDMQCDVVHCCVRRMTVFSLGCFSQSVSTFQCSKPC